MCYVGHGSEIMGGVYNCTIDLQIVAVGRRN
jgi:hypothetical protein